MQLHMNEYVEHPQHCAIFSLLIGSIPDVETL